MMALVLEVEYLSGVCFASVGPDSTAPDWPPQPDRIFSALVASWAARGRDESEAEALKWLEGLSVPHICASASTPRTAAIVFVPPNDSRSDKQKNAKGVLPALRSRQPRSFPATRPVNPTVKFMWRDARADKDKVQALQRLANDTAYVGHSTSLTRCRFVCSDVKPAMAHAELPRRSIYAGRFNELCRHFESGRRPLAGAMVAAPAVSPLHAHPCSVFDGRWLLLEHIAGDMPDVRACAVVAKTIRDSVLDGYGRIMHGEQIPEVISGHGPDGAPTRLPHLAIVPLPVVGSAYADGHVMGFAVVPPREVPILEEEMFRKVLRKLAPIEERRGRRVLTLKTRRGAHRTQAFCVDLSPTFEPPAGKRSLDASLYLGPATTWATVTPIVFDRHVRASGDARQQQVAQQIAAACRHIGLPEPYKVVVDKNSLFEGSVPAYPSPGEPAWMRWRLPSSLLSRELTHAVIQFCEPVRGPVILGSGRFVGLGLCRPLTPERH